MQIKKGKIEVYYGIEEIKDILSEILKQEFLKMINEQ